MNSHLKLYLQVYLVFFLTRVCLSGSEYAIVLEGNGVRMKGKGKVHLATYDNSASLNENNLSYVELSLLEPEAYFEERIDWVNGVVSDPNGKIKLFAKGAIQLLEELSVFIYFENIFTEEDDLQMLLKNFPIIGRPRWILFDGSHNVSLVVDHNNLKLRVNLEIIKDKTLPDVQLISNRKRGPPVIIYGFNFTTTWSSKSNVVRIVGENAEKFHSTKGDWNIGMIGSTENLQQFDKIDNITQCPYRGPLEVVDIVIITKPM